MTQELSPLDPPSLGRYRLLARLGRGGMGIVYLARSPGGRPVAVKSIRPDLAAYPEFRRRFRSEVAVLRHVNGLYTAVLVDADTDGPMPWLATAYVEGPSLAAAIQRGGPLPLRSVLLLAAALAEGLQAIHAAGIAHRDLKPANVLLAADGPRVIDFGISRSMSGADHDSPGHRFATPAYMSPEQAAGAVAGTQSDMFSLGRVLMFAATGQIGNLCPLPAGLRPVIAHCLARDPGQRPTPAQLLGQLGASDLDPDWRSLAARCGVPHPARPLGRGALRPGAADRDTEFATMPVG